MVSLYCLRVKLYAILGLGICYNEGEKERLQIEVHSRLSTLIHRLLSVQGGTSDDQK